MRKWHVRDRSIFIMTPLTFVVRRGVENQAQALHEELRFFLAVLEPSPPPSATPINTHC